MAITVISAGTTGIGTDPGLAGERVCLMVGGACDNQVRRGYFRGRDRRRTMPALDEDDRPKKKIAHEIGQDLTLLSVKELNERIALMQEEISRLEADIARKQASRSAADQFFKK
jgi:uncharacterized small protein (DUF1192 family)